MNELDLMCVCLPQGYIGARQILHYFQIVLPWSSSQYLYIIISFCIYYKNTQSCYALIPQGILLVYDITNGWSFDGIDRWIREIDEVIPFNSFDDTLC